MSAGRRRGRVRARLAAVPAPLVALLLLFVLSLVLVVAQVALGAGSDERRGVAETAASSGGAVEPLPEPERIRVPAMDLDERLIDLGIARDGTMQVPADPDRVGWFAGGGRPGGPGPTVVAAHVDSLEGPAVFARLSDVAPGDEVLLDTAAGTATYVVTDVRAVPRDDFPTARVFGATRRDVVRLITCHGPYDRGGAGYTENLVVTARRA